MITVSAKLHFNLCKEIRVKLDNKHRYDHVTKSVKTSHEGKVTLLWKQQVQTNRTIPNNKPDIIIHDNKQGTCMLIDVAIPGDRNVVKRDAERILKYKDLTTEIQCMWNVKAYMIPVLIGVTETISKSLRQYLSNILGKHEITELQKTAILGTEHKLQKVLMLKYKTYFMGEITLHVAQTVNIEQL